MRPGASAAMARDGASQPPPGPAHPGAPPVPWPVVQLTSRSHGPGGVPPSPDRPVFIVGDQRSGTTLARSLFSAHPGLAVTPETHFLQVVDNFRRRGQTVGRGSDLAPADFGAFWARYRAGVRFRDLEIDPDRCLALLSDPDPPFRSVFRAVLTAYLERTGKPRIGEKTPRHVYFLDRIIDWFPDASVVVMRRDPRAVIASKLATPWMRRKVTPPSAADGVVRHGRTELIVRLADTWVDVYDDIVGRWRDDPRVTVTAYEDLVSDPSGQLRRLCGRLDLGFSPDMIAGRDERSVPPPSGEPADRDWSAWRQRHNAKARDPVTTGSIERWREVLRPTEVALIESRCAGVMRAAGYEPATTGPRALLGRALGHAVPVAVDAERRLRSVAGATTRAIAAR